MAEAAQDDGPLGQLIVVPHTWHDDSLWSDIQAETQDRIGAALRAMYAVLLQQPLSPQLAKRVREIEACLEDIPRGR